MRFAHAAPRGASPPWTPLIMRFFLFSKGPRSSWVAMQAVMVYNTTLRRRRRENFF